MRSVPEGGSVKRLRVCLIGCGAISPFHLAGWKQVEDAELVALCDLDPRKAQVAAAQHGVPAVYTDYMEMVAKERPDAVDVVTPTATHAEIVGRLADCGVHVLCQKPLAEDMAEAVAMVEACERAGVTMMVHQNFRAQPFPVYIKGLIDDGVLGRVHYCRFFHRLPYCVPGPDGRVRMLDREPYLARYEPLVLLHMVIHHLDTSRYLMGEPTSLYAVNHTFGGNTQGENHVNVVLNYPDVICTIDESWVTPGVETIGFWVEGDRRVVAAENDDLTVHHADGRTSRTTMQELYPGYAETHNIDYYSFHSVQRQFTECVLTGRVPTTNGRDNLKSLNLVFKAFQSTYTNSVVMV